MVKQKNLPENTLRRMKMKCSRDSRQYSSDIVDMETGWARELWNCLNKWLFTFEDYRTSIVRMRRYKSANWGNKCAPLIVYEKINIDSPSDWYKPKQICESDDGKECNRLSAVDRNRAQWDASPNRPGGSIPTFIQFLQREHLLCRKKRGKKTNSVWCLVISSNLNIIQCR